MGEPMRAPLILRRVLWVLMLGGGIVLAGEVGWVPRASAAQPGPEREYIAVFERGSIDQPFAVLEKPKGAPVGAGTNIEIDAFGLRVAAIDASHAEALLRRLPELDRGKSQQLPPGFRVYADSRYVVPSYASGSQKYKIIFTDPADATGTGKGECCSGGGGGGGGSM